MERKRFAFGALTAALALLAAACTSGAGAGAPAPSPTTVPALDLETTDGGTDAGPAALPDLSARPISVDELQAMLPTGESGPAATGEPVKMDRSNEDLIVGATLDRADEVADIDRFERMGGVGTAYPGDGATAYVWVDLFETPEGAAGWVTDTAGDIVKQAGGSHQPTISLSHAEEYPFGVGHNPIGLILGLDEGALTETIGMYSLGRIAVFVSVVRSDAADTRVPVQYLAEEVEDRILAVLLGSSVETAVSGGPASYEFEFERTVVIGDQAWRASSSGVVDGTDLSCRVFVDEPLTQANREFVVVAGSLWVRNGAAGFEPTGAAGAVDRQLMTLCPAWPTDLAAAGLTGVLGSTPATHTIGGLQASGYRGTAADLEAALGVIPGTADIEVFNVWVAAGTGWIVELDVTLTGDPDDLQQLIGPGFPSGAPATIHLTQRAGDFDGAGPVRPPG